MNDIINPITVRQLLQYVNCENEAIQIMDGDSWDCYTEYRVNSFLLKPFLDYQIVSLGAISDGVIRIEILNSKEN